MSGLTPPVGHGGTGLHGNDGGSAALSRVRASSPLHRARERDRGRGRIAWGVGGIALLVFVLAGVVVYQSAFCCAGGSSDAAHAGLAYAREQMVWLQGPSVQSSHTIPLRQLEGTLRQRVSPQVRNDVNVSDLVHRYGPNREVTLVVLNGEYNSLPPDEGVDMHGDVVVLMDARTDRVLLLMD